MKSPLTLIDKDRFGPWAIVTGASSGIGKEFARQLAASGINVVLVARRLAALEEVGREVAKQFGVQYRAVMVDLTDEDFLEKVEEATHDLDVGLLISNAGEATPGEFLTSDFSEILKAVQLNALAHLKLTHHYGRILAKRGRGGVVLVSAMGAPQGIPYMSKDSASKAFVFSLGESLHLEFEKLGLNLTVLLPGPTDTPVLARFGLDPASMPMKPMSVGQCVAETLAAFRVNRSSHLSGRMNRIMFALVPDSVLRKMMGKMLAEGLASKALPAKTPDDTVK